MKQPKDLVSFAFLSLAALAALNLAFSLWAGDAPPKKEMTEIEKVKRGRYLVSFGGCNDCHTPKKMTDRGPVDDEARRLSGHPGDAKLQPPPAAQNSPWSASTAGLTAWAGPWGISYAANLTPDQNTGMGIWTEEMFIKSMRNGKHMGDGRPILPPMPWEGVAKLTDEDLRAVFAYLRSLPPISNRVPDATGPDNRAHE